ncbi:MAG: electron transfer flavoprotein subunit alpha/FixB family protein [Phycisphaerae bacterium]|nr:electron transfer flavoprotein subunit alpha/FixB family protein [Phycisphaerae bacterium]
MNTLVLAEMQSGRLRGTTLSAVRFAQEIAEQTGGQWSAVVIGGQGVADVAERLGSFGPAKVYTVVGDAFEHCLAGPYSVVLAKLVEEHGFEVIATASTTTGRDVMPRLAARLGAGMVTGVCAWESRDGSILYKRKVFSGGVVASVTVSSPIHVLTIDATEFSDPMTGEQADVVAFEPGGLGAAYRARFAELQSHDSARPDLTEADTVIGFGRGVKDPANISNVEKLADILGAALGGTRAVVDSGWMPNDLQVGQTGKQIAPKLYFALGLSGSIQHIAGIRGAKKIVAINKDPEAAIFEVADIGLVADMQVAVPEIVELLGE